MSLEIRQTYSKIAINTTPGKWEIETQKAELDIRQKHARVSMSSELPKIEIDQYECFASVGLKNVSDFTREAAQLGKQQALAYIGKTSSDGRRMAAIHKGGSPIADIAKRDSSPVHEFGLRFLPDARPAISVQEGSLQIEPERNGEGIHNGVEGDYMPGYVETNYIRGNLEIYLSQQASISISYKGENVDTYL